jgi:DNA-binding transcriptional ArsR family regulator
MPRPPDAAKLSGAAPLFAALGDDTRLRIVARLCEGGPLPIVRLAAGATVSRQAVTKHLHALEEANLVRSFRAGRERIWELKPERLDEARRWLDQISQQWDAAVGRLRALVESDEPRAAGARAPSTRGEPGPGAPPPRAAARRRPRGDRGSG